MERIERVVVPITEAINYLQQGDDAHLRLALLLLDSTAELLMHRRTTATFRLDSTLNSVVRQH
jgi:hypothetical protein